MIAALIQGSLFRAPEQRMSKSGKAYTKATIKEVTADEIRWVNIIAFSESAQNELIRLRDGDAAALQGPLKAEIYMPPDGTAKVSLSLIANLVIALRQPPKQRKPAAAPAAPDTRSRQERLAGTWTAESGDPNDDIDFVGES